MAKKLTPTIARALAEKVLVELRTKVNGMEDSIKKKIYSSKEWKEYVKLYQERKKISDRIDTLQRVIKDTHTNNVAKVDIYTYSNNPEVRIYDNGKNVSLDAIKDTILIEDYMSGGTETAEELINRITTKLLKS